MGILLIALAGCFLILAIVLLIAWRKTDWKKLDKANEAFYDSDGNHAYYDRSLIKMKKKAASQKSNKK